MVYEYVCWLTFSMENYSYFPSGECSPNLTQCPCMIFFFVLRREILFISYYLSYVKCL